MLIPCGARLWRHLLIYSQVKSGGQGDGFLKRSAAEWRKVLSDSFLPVGFPHSVSEDYLSYQTYDSLQAFFSTITALLANRALLEGLGVGDANSSATFALLLTILKDAMSRIATILFAHRFGLRIEPDAKRYRFLADIFNDTAFFLELYSPYFGSWGKVVALSTGEALRALCGVAAGASKAALSVHFARHDNLAELNAKEASQETAVGLVGLLVGTLVVKMVEDHRSVVYLMILLVFAHLWMNYLGVRSVCMTTLNRQRATILFSEYLRTGTILSPKQVAHREHIIFWDPVVCNKYGQLICRIEVATDYQQATTRNAGETVSVVDGQMSTLVVHSPGAGKRRGSIKILLWAGCEPVHAIKAWLLAMQTAKTMSRRSQPTAKDAQQSSLVDESKLWRSLPQLGWNLDTQAFETDAPIRIRVRTARSKKK